MLKKECLCFRYDYAAHVNLFIPKAYPFHEVVLYFLKYLSGTAEIYPYLPNDINGYYYDGHIHSKGSDGRNTLREIVEYISKVKYKNLNQTKPPQYNQ